MYFLDIYGLLPALLKAFHLSPSRSPKYTRFNSFNPVLLLSSSHSSTSIDAGTDFLDTNFSKAMLLLPPSKFPAS